MFKRNFINLCNEKGEAPSAVCRKVGITPATFSGWTDQTIPRQATLFRIANYFNVSVEQLLSDYDAEREKVAEEVATMMDDLTEDERQDVIKYIDFLKAKRGDS